MHRFRSLIKVTAPAQGFRSSISKSFPRYMATVATHDNMPSTIRPSYSRKLTTTSGDYDLSYTPDVRKTLGTYGLTPPAVESYDVQMDRCESEHYRPIECNCSYSHRPPPPGHEADAPREIPVPRPPPGHQRTPLLQTPQREHQGLHPASNLCTRKTDMHIGIDSSHLHPDCRRSLLTMARDLDTT
jgi:hypothetical protein